MAPEPARPKVAILGGGMGALTTALHLSAPGWEDRFERITVYERGWVLGGKGASVRGVFGRIEEHALHVWMGYYDNAFRLMRDVYRELDRPHTDPECPIAGFGDAFLPSDRVGVADLHAARWSVWMAEFGRNGLAPGEPGPRGPRSLVDFARRALQLLAEFAGSLLAAERSPARPRPRARLTRSEHAPPPSPRPGWPAASTAVSVAEQAGRTALAGAWEVLSIACADSTVLVGGDANPMSGLLDEALDALLTHVRALAAPDPTARRTFQLLDVIVSSLRGACRDGLLADPRRLRGLNDLDFRAWLAHHGAAAETLDSPLIRGVYDLAFAYEDADPSRPRFPAGLGLYLSARMFFDYKGAIFWKMAAGMGEIVFAPMYQVLRARGVRFEFFHQVDALHLSPDGRSLASVDLTREVVLASGVQEYDPLVRVRGLPCWPSSPNAAQIDRRAGDRVTLHLGDDFDLAVLGISLGALPTICSELVERLPAWRAMVTKVGTVPTQSVQLWLDATEAELGWRFPGATVSGYLEPFDTWASMGHLLEQESWDESHAPRALTYLCSALRAPADAEPAAAKALVHANVLHFLTNHSWLMWPRGMRIHPNRFRWELLHDPEDRKGYLRLGAQVVRANVDPSDRYVQALPGTDGYRLRCDGSGVRNLYLTGDWIDSGLNAGCIEAAVIAGAQASNAIWGRPDLDEITGLRDLRTLFG